MDSQLTLKDIKGLFRRRRKTCLFVFSAMFFTFVLIAMALPPIYQSQAMIMIDEQQIPSDYVKTTITTYAQQRLEMISRQIMKYSQLKEMVLQFGLYPDMIKNGDLSGAVDEMKDNILLETISTKEGNESSTVAFTLAYGYQEPETARKVTEALVNLYMEEELKAREKQVSVTADFLKAELENIKQQVQAHEQRISEFKRRHIGELPENMAFNLQNMTRLERELESIDSRLRNLEDRKIYLKGQMANIEPLRPVQTQEGKVATNPSDRLKGLRLDLIRMQSRLSEKHPDIRKLRAEIAELERQVGSGDEALVKMKALEQKRAELAELSGRLGPRHPDAVSLAREVEILSKQVDKLLQQKSISEASAEKPDNPAYINLMTQLASAEFEIKSLVQERAAIESNYKSYIAKNENAPNIEREYKELTLDYTNAKSQYDDILNKLMEAQVAQEMEHQQKGEKFTILEPPFLPNKPSKPNRIAIILLGFVLACGASAGVCAVQESMDHSLKNEDQLARVTGLPVLSTVSLVETEEERRAKRVRRTIYALGTVATVVVILIILNSYAFPIDELLNSIRTRLAL